MNHINHIIQIRKKLKDFQEKYRVGKDSRSFYAEQNAYKRYDDERLFFQMLKENVQQLLNLIHLKIY